MAQHKTQFQAGIDGIFLATLTGTEAPIDANIIMKLRHPGDMDVLPLAGVPIRKANVRAVGELKAAMGHRPHRIAETAAAVDIDKTGIFKKSLRH